MEQQIDKKQVKEDLEKWMKDMLEIHNKMDNMYKRWRELYESLER